MEFRNGVFTVSWFPGTASVNQPRSQLFRGVGNKITSFRRFSYSLKGPARIPLGDALTAGPSGLYCNERIIVGNSQNEG